MALNTVTSQFLAALGLERSLDREMEAHARAFYRRMLVAYRQEMQYERARLMRQSPMDYKTVRQMDRDLDAITRRLRELELEQLNSG